MVASGDGAGRGVAVPRSHSLWAVGLVLLAMSTGVFHGHLFGPDEPRVAEIARAALMEGHRVVPVLNGHPFLEKPPLHYDLVAAVWAALGETGPGSARAVSAVLGLGMLAATGWLLVRLSGARAAWIGVLLLLTMIRFWGYSHTIHTDPAVGAFATPWREDQPISRSS